MIDVMGMATDHGTLDNPRIRLLDSDGRNWLDGDNNSGTGEDARIAYTADAGETLYLEVRHASDDGLGSYTVLVSGTDWTGTSRSDRFIAGERGDTLKGGNGADRLFCEGGNDVIFGNNGNDRIDGGDGDDALLGGNQHDRMDGGRGEDTIDGDKGNDRLDSGHDNDFIKGFDGNDQINGESDDDILNGERGHDFIEGGNRNDILQGARGRDLLRGEAGDDILEGGHQADSLVGGSGADIFRYDALSHSRATEGLRDTILDFGPEEGDRHDLSHLDGASGFTVVDAFTGAGSELVLEDGSLKLDLNGNGRPDFQIDLSGFQGTFAWDDLILI